MNKTLDELFEAWVRAREQGRTASLLLGPTQTSWIFEATAAMLGKGLLMRALQKEVSPDLLSACAWCGCMPAVRALTSQTSIESRPDPERVVFAFDQSCDENVLASWLIDAANRGPVLALHCDDLRLLAVLMAVPHWANDFYWLGPAPDPALPSAARRTFELAGYSPEECMIALAQRWGCFPPPWLAAPLELVQGRLRSLGDFPVPGQNPICLKLAGHSQRLEQSSHHWQRDRSIEAENLFVGGRYQKLIERFDDEPDLPAPLVEWLVWSHLNQGDEAFSQATSGRIGKTESLFETAATHYLAALQRRPGFPPALKKMAELRFHQGCLARGSTMEELFQQACERYAAYAAVAEPDARLLSHWGSALAVQAYGSDSDAAQAVYEAAEEKFQAALTRDPGCYEALAGWGHALVERASVLPVEEGRVLYLRALDKLQRALEKKPEAVDILNNLGLTYLALGRSSKGEERENYLGLAEERLLKADALVPGFGSYNLACLAAQRGDIESCRSWLERSFSNGLLPPRRLVEADPDLKALHSQPWFKRFVRRLNS